MNNNEFLQRVKNGLKHSSERRLTLKVFQVIKNFLQESDYIQEFKFPSSRFLSESLGISRDTIEKAYELLENEKLVYRVKGKGTFSIPSQIPRTIQEEGNSSLPEQLIQLETLFFDQNLDFFADGMPEVRNFPFKKWYDTEKLALEQNGLNIFLKDNTQGLPLLRQEIANLVNTQRHSRVQPENILIVNSTQQALYLCGRVLFHPNDRVIMENPYYSNASHLFKMMGLNIHYCDIDAQGLMIEHCHHFTDIKAIYVTPASQYPTGIQMSMQRKKEIVAYARQQNSFIIEDDYDALLLNRSENDAILGLDSCQRTIYIGSFSKYILPSLRMSYMILPSALVDAFTRYRNYIDGSAPSQYFQTILGKFMQRGYYAEYLTQMQRIYHERYEAFIFYFHQYLSEFCFIHEHSPAMQVACYFKENLPDELEESLVQAAALKNISLTRLSQFYAQHPSYGFVLGFSSLNPTEIKSCMLQLHGLITTELKRVNNIIVP